MATFKGNWNGLFPNDDIADTIYGNTLPSDWGGRDDIIDGFGGNDRLFGRGGNDTIRGGDGDDLIVGGSGNDTLSGGAGNDTFIYESGTDSISGGTGYDILEFRNVDLQTDFFGNISTALLPEDQPIFFDVVSGDVMTGETLIGQISSLSSIEEIKLTNNNDTLNDNNTGRTITANGGDDIVHGNGGNDLIFGGTGNDTLTGDDGDDIIVGGRGRDVMTGGDGDDIFRFDAATDAVMVVSGNFILPGDSITDFQSGFDQIDLTRIDANTRVSGNQAFTVVQQFSGNAGELVVRNLVGFTFISADVNGDRATDFQLQTNGLALVSDMLL